MESPIGGGRMIKLHRINGNEMVVNVELIESVEIYGKDTVLLMATGNRIVVLETVTEVVQKCVEHKKNVFAGASYLPEFLRGAERSPSCH